MIKNFKFLKIVLLGFGFLSISLLWSLYNTDIPVILQKSYKISSFAVGWIMNLDNILALFLIPLIGALSDRTWTKLGKRMPYIITSLPLGAIFFSFIPWIPVLFGINTSSLILLIIIILLMNIFQAIGRGPVISLMPDLVPPENRSPANGIINFMGGLGSLIAYFIVGRISAVNRTLGFTIAGLIQIISVLIIFLAINESKDSLVMAKVEREDNEFSFKKLINLKDKNLIFLLLAIFFWFIGFNAVETFYSVYMALEKGLDPTLGESIAKSNLGILALTFMIFSIPSGLIAKRIGRKNTIIIGLLGMIFIFIGLISFQNLSIIRIFFMLGGLFWALININSLPMVLDLGDLKSQGTYTGFYYFSSQFASIVAPPFAGFLADLLKTCFVIFPLGGIFFTLSLLMMLQIKIKEPKRKEN